MRKRFYLYRRGQQWYAEDAQTKKRQPLHTTEKQDAQRILNAKNEALRQSAVNLAIGKAYLAARDPQLIERTWSQVMEDFCNRGKETTRRTRRRVLATKPFGMLADKRLVDTTEGEMRAALATGGVMTNCYLRCLQNLALGMGWLPAPVIPPLMWPKTVPKAKRAITRSEHERIIAAERSPERRLYYEILWETGAAQTDGANLTSENIDWGQKILGYQRCKTGERAYLRIGSRLEALLRQLPTQGPLFPHIRELQDRDRAAEFRRRCRLLHIEGVSLHSYRYAWAQRAKVAGVPERFAQAALGHASKAVHRAYANATETVVVCPALEGYESKTVHAAFQ